MSASAASSRVLTTCSAVLDDAGTAAVLNAEPAHEWDEVTRLDQTSPQPSLPRLYPLSEQEPLDVRTSGPASGPPSPPSPASGSPIQSRSPDGRSVRRRPVNERPPRPDAAVALRSLEAQHLDSLDLPRPPCTPRQQELFRDAFRSGTFQTRRGFKPPSTLVGLPAAVRSTIVDNPYHPVSRRRYDQILSFVRKSILPLLDTTRATLRQPNVALCVRILRSQYCELTLVLRKWLPRALILNALRNQVGWRPSQVSLRACPAGRMLGAAADMSLPFPFAQDLEEDSYEDVFMNRGNELDEVSNPLS